jgi:hypothetical protein
MKFKAGQAVLCQLRGKRMAGLSHEIQVPILRPQVAAKAKAAQAGCGAVLPQVRQDVESARVEITFRLYKERGFSISGA